MKVKRIVLALLVFAVAGVTVFAQTGASGSGRSSSGRYTLTVNSNVRGAQIFVNAVLQKGVTPMSLTLSRGSYSITVRADGYRDYVANINLARDMTINANLQPITHSLTITSAVQNSTVYIDGQARGRAPTRLNLPQGRYTVMIEAENYYPYTQVVSLSRDVTVNAQLEPVTFVLNVTSNVQGANVYLDGSMIGNAPLRAEVSPGRYTLSLTAAGFADFSQVIDVNDRFNINVNMRKATSQVTFSVPAQFLNAAIKDPLRLFEVFIDGDKIRTPLSSAFEVEAGTHLVRVQTGGFVFEARFVFDSGRDYLLEFSPALLLKPAIVTGR